MSSETVESLTQQVEDLYEDKKQLQDELGVSDPDDVIDMVRSLQDQLEDLYAEKAS